MQVHLVLCMWMNLCFHVLAVKCHSIEHAPCRLLTATIMQHVCQLKRVSLCELRVLSVQAMQSRKFCCATMSGICIKRCKSIAPAPSEAGPASVCLSVSQVSCSAVPVEAVQASAVAANSTWTLSTLRCLLKTLVFCIQKQSIFIKHSPIEWWALGPS